MNVGVIGGGPAGSWFACRAALAGYQVTLWEQALGWEKPCGGGIVERAFRRFPVLEAGAKTSTLCPNLTIISPQNRVARVQLDHPIRVVNRAELQTKLLTLAQQQGATIRLAKVEAVSTQHGRWTVKTSGEQTPIEFLVIANGSGSSFTRGLLPRYPADAMNDTLMGLAPTVRTPEITFKLLPRFPGYLWEFPRLDQTSVGIGYRRGLVSPTTARRILRDWIDVHYGRLGAAINLVSRSIPALTRPDWRAARFSGPQWAALGDAAGLADPLSGEGIYYALLSADILADCLIANDLTAFDLRVKTELGLELQKASGLRDLFYDPRIQELIVICLNSSKRFQHIVDKLLRGDLGYQTIRSEVAKNAGGVLWDLLRKNPLALPTVLRGAARIRSGPTRLPWLQKL